MKSFSVMWTHENHLGAWIEVSRGHESKTEAALAIWSTVAENEGKWGGSDGRSTYRIRQVVTTELSEVGGL